MTLNISAMKILKALVIKYLLYGKLNAVSYLRKIFSIICVKHTLVLLQCRQVQRSIEIEMENQLFLGNFYIKFII